jgi:hypothetical protein
MPLQLTTEINVGDLNSHNITHAKIINFRCLLEDNLLDFDLAYGHLDGESFVRTDLKPKQSYQIVGDEFIELVGSTHGAADVLVYDTIANVLYQWLIDHSILAGTVI